MRAMWHKQNSAFNDVKNCDASDYDIGGMLYHDETYRDENDERKVMGHVNRTLNAAERNYCTSEKETLPIVCCLNKFRCYLVE